MVNTLCMIWYNNNMVNRTHLMDLIVEQGASALSLFLSLQLVPIEHMICKYDVKRLA